MAEVQDIEKSVVDNKSSVASLADLTMNLKDQTLQTKVRYDD